jgi:hypothetical protein
MVPNIREAIMWSYEVWSKLDAQIVKITWRMARILSTTWNVDFSLVDEREHNKMQEESDDLGAMTSRLRLSDDEMLIETYIQMKGEEIPELELNTDELVGVALGINYAQGLVLMLICIQLMWMMLLHLQLSLVLLNVMHHCCLIYYKIIIYVLVLMELLVFKSQ